MGSQVRATLPGGNAGEFIIGSPEVAPTMSLYLFHVLKTTEDEFREVTRNAAAEDEIIVWAHGKTSNAATLQRVACRATRS